MSKKDNSFKINIYFKTDGISILEVLEKDFNEFLQEYLDNDESKKVVN